MRNLYWRAIAGATALALAACGGGGGNSTVVADQPLVPGTGGTPGGPAGSPTVQLKGKLLFESIPVSATAGLEYAKSRFKPARAIEMRLTSPSGQMLGVARTDAEGRYSFIVAANSTVVLSAFPSMAQAQGQPAQGLTEVRDNTADYQMNGVSTEPTPVGSTAREITVTIPAGGAASKDGAHPLPRHAAPFALLDTIYEARSKVLDVAPDLKFPPLYLLWSARNRPSTTFDPSQGQLGSTAFLSQGGQNIILVLGAEGVDTDEYDASVIVHEWGHFLMQSQSRDESGGGSHREGDLLAPELAFSEGFADALSGMVLGNAQYLDTWGPSQASVAVMALDAGPVMDKGWFNELSIAQVMLALHRSVGMEPIVHALTGPFRSLAANTTIHAFNASLAQVRPAAATNFAALLRAQKIDPSADAWGSAETNDGGSDTALPVTQQLVLGAELKTACVSHALDPRGEGNKLGAVAQLRFTAPQPGAHRVLITGPAGSNPGFFLRRPLGSPVVGGTTDSAVEDHTVALTAGDYILSVFDQKRPPAKTCFTVKIQ